jgi:ketosteroid isomerase-like protein
LIEQQKADRNCEILTATMSEENVEVVQNVWGGSEGRTLEETAEAYWHPDIEYFEDPRWPGASKYRGRDSVLRCFQSYIETLGPAEAITVTLEQVVDAGERLVALVRFQGLSPSGVPHEHLWAYLVEVRDGRIVRFQAFYEAQDALEAAG